MSEAAHSEEGPGEKTFLRALLGDEFFASRWVRRFNAIPLEYRVALAVAVFGALIFIPFLGAVGLWDCWEPHYGEVARQMIQRNDYVVPWWEGAWFYSKPPLLMWMTALGMQLVGTTRTALGSPVALYTEWAMRLPVTLYSIFGLAAMAFALARTVGKRVALTFGVALVTMPLYFLLSRQAVTDTPLIASLMCAMACAIIGQLDEKTRHRSAWWYGFYFFCGLGVMAKESLGIAIPAATLLLYGAVCVIPWTADSIRAHLRWLLSGSFRAEVREGKSPMPALWAQCFRMRLLTGTLVFFAVVTPWYWVMFHTTALGAENETFWYRVIFHDNFSRLGSGVYTTTPGGAFTYFFHQGGYAVFPWVALVPGIVALLAGLKLRQLDRKGHVAAIAFFWSAISFFVVAISATKFHHYIFPALPGIAVLCALFVEKLWDEGVSHHAFSLILGGMLFVLVGKDLAEHPKNFTDLFVFNYGRAYPDFLDTRPVELFGKHPLWVGHLVALLLLGVGLWLVADLFSRKGTSVWARGGAVAVGLAGAGVLLLTTAGSGLLRKGGLTTPVTVKMGMGYAFALCGVLCLIAMIARARTLLFTAFLTLAVGLSGWYSWSHWVDLSAHWTQRDLFWRYYKMGEPNQPIAAFFMNWRGETFYSRDTVVQIRDMNDNFAKLRAYADQPGRKWLMVEHYRLHYITDTLSARHHLVLVDPDLNNKFVMVRID